MSGATAPLRPLGSRSALVTGASRGIGRATALGLAAEGAHVALLARDAEALESLAETIRRTHDVHAIVLPCDVRDPTAVAIAVGRLGDALGGVPDVLVNNAGTFTLAPLDETTPDAFAAALDANLVAPYRFVHAFVGAMQSRGTGHIVTVGSIADRAAFPGNAAYAPSKFGLRGLHEVLREELRGSGVRATLVSPGATDTALWDAIDPDSRPGFTPRARMLRPDDVAAAIVYAVTAPPHVNVDELRLSPA
jgi:NADP-dependent 3-hydroxy acid dehydrogenase YdfG